VALPKYISSHSAGAVTVSRTRVAADTLDDDLAGEAHVRAVEPGDLGEDALGALDGFDHAGPHDRVLAAERDAVVLAAAGGGVVVVDRGVGGRLAGDRVRMLASLLEAHQGTVVGQILPSLASMKMGTSVWPYFRSAVMSEAITQ
jgi:hypothetical protein